MNQRLVSSRFPFIPIRVTVVGSTVVADVEALIDTGFDGDVVLPEIWLDALGPPDKELKWRIADGSEVLTASYAANVQLVGIDGSYPAVLSVLGTEVIVGRGVTDRFLVSLDHGQSVIVEP